MTTWYDILTWLSSNAWWLLLAFTCGYGIAYYELSKEIADLRAMLASAEEHEK